MTPNVGHPEPVGISHIQQLDQTLLETMRYNYCRGRDNNCS
jgi:hypothetical protein